MALCSSFHLTQREETAAQEDLATQWVSDLTGFLWVKWVHLRGSHAHLWRHRHLSTLGLCKRSLQGFKLHFVTITVLSAILCCRSTQAATFREKVETKVTWKFLIKPSVIGTLLNKNYNNACFKNKTFPYHKYHEMQIPSSEKFQSFFLPLTVTAF